MSKFIQFILVMTFTVSCAYAQGKEMKISEPELDKELKQVSSKVYAQRDDDIAIGQASNANNQGHGQSAKGRGEAASNYSNNENEVSTFSGAKKAAVVHKDERQDKMHRGSAKKNNQGAAASGTQKKTHNMKGNGSRQMSTGATKNAMHKKEKNQRAAPNTQRAVKKHKSPAPKNKRKMGNVQRKPEINQKHLKTSQRKVNTKQRDAYQSK
ncbi:MAG: hypothetical protein HOI53_01765 [Francisellaceae bacterium]|jgi:hypothetical protein|nr:hypothetical protein [Francisellaceae bacterium]MBT6206730.1 hypothetical protein [Francisellaceae bacterium]